MCILRVRVMSAETILTEAVDAYRSALGERLLAAYALGSVAHGGFSALVSDIDLGLVLSDPISSRDPRTVLAVADAQKAKGSELGERLSVFWGTPSTLSGDSQGGRFPELVGGAEFALEYLAGAAPRGRSRLKGWARSARREADAVQEIRRPETLLARGVRRVTKLVLFPVRFLFTADTG